MSDRTIPYRVFSLPSLHLVQEPKRKNYARMKHEKHSIQMGQPRVSGLLDQQSCHKKQSCNHRAPLWKSLAVLCQAQNWDAEVWDQFCGCGRIIFLVLFHSIKQISCPFQDHPAPKTRNWGLAQWDSLNNNSHFSLRICMLQKQLAFATNVT